MSRYWKHIDISLCTIGGKILAACLLVLWLQGCSVSKYLAPGEVFYDGATLDIRQDSGQKIKNKALYSELKGLLRPVPNKKFFGRRQKAWYYFVAGKTEKEKGIRHWMKNRLGEPPVLMQDADTGKNVRVLTNYLENNGYFTARAKADSVWGKTRGKVHYDVYPGPRYAINAVYFPSDSSLIGRLVSATSRESLLRPGDPYIFQILKDERVRIDEAMKKRGYYLFNPDYLLMKVDSTIGNKMVNIYVTLKTGLPADALKPWRINDIVLFPNFEPSQDSILTITGIDSTHFMVIDPRKTYAPEIFQKIISFKPGMLYNIAAHNETLSRLVNIGTFRYVKNNFRELSSRGDTGLLQAYYYLYSSKRRNLRFETTGKTSSANLAGMEMNLNWRNRNLFRGGEQLMLKLYGGLDVQLSGQNEGYNIYHFGVEGSISWPRMVPFNFVKPGSFVPYTRLLLSNEWQRREKLYTVNTLKASYGWAWRPDIRKEHALYPFQVTFVNNSNVTDEYLAQIALDSNLARIIQEQLIVGPEYTYIYNNTLNPKKWNGWYYKANVSLSNNITGLLQGANAATGANKTIFGVAYSQFVKAEQELRYYRKILPGNNDFKWVNRINAGIGIPYGNSLQLPYIKQFFTGGANSLRAFRVRSVGPGTFRPNINPGSFIPDFTGDIKLELNSELRAKIRGLLHGALFVDAGNVWLFRENDKMPGARISGKFLQELAVGAGLGLRFDIAGVFMLRLDAGIPLRKPWLPAGQRWIIDEINFGSSTWRTENLVINLAVGLPF